MTPLSMSKTRCVGKDAPTVIAVVDGVKVSCWTRDDLPTPDYVSTSYIISDSLRNEFTSGSENTDLGFKTGTHRWQ